LRHLPLEQECLENVLFAAEASAHHIYVVAEVSQQVKNPLFDRLVRSTFSELFVGNSHL